MLDNTISVATQYGHVFLGGLWTTLLLSAVTVLLGTLFGSLVCILKMSKYKILRFISTAYIEIIRGTPLLLQLYIFYYLLPMITGYDPGKFVSVSLALTVNSTAYVAEIIRSGIQAVDIGQTEAARSLGLNAGQTMIHIVMPQAIKNILPTLGNEFVMVIKETSLASTFFVGDIMTQYLIIKSATYLTIEPLFIVGGIYFVCTFTLSKLIALFERRLATSD